MPDAKSIPLSAHELRDAIRHGQRVDTSRLDRILRPEDRGVIEVQAATPWRNIAALLRPGDTQSEAASLQGHHADDRRKHRLQHCGSGRTPGSHAPRVADPGYSGRRTAPYKPRRQQ